MIHDTQSAHLASVRFNCTSCAQVYELPQSHCGDNREGTLFSQQHICYAHLASVRFNCTSCAQVHELPQSNCGDNQEGTLFSQ